MAVEREMKILIAVLTAMVIALIISAHHHFSDLAEDCVERGGEASLAYQSGICNLDVTDESRTINDKLDYLIELVEEKK